jgi:hypothetical protein
MFPTFELAGSLESVWILLQCRMSLEELWELAHEVPTCHASCSLLINLSLNPLQPL